MQKPRERMLGKGKCLITLKSSDKEKMKKQAEELVAEELELSNNDVEDTENVSDGEEEPAEESEEITTNVSAQAKSEPEPEVILKKKVVKKLKV